ncbi:hypothetical protein GCM10022403_081310 [Streptomyces coacervatus]|uniref:Uncharacterized protein n=1 Tax=Streptomyces coacervatus TaxID=647381 RepID=A0ABP7J8M7_9ACTN|nr:hypothetical protein [Streptomyces coacervatus]MDF2270505.1 hypothetical protein [Streptomyces coacervatus]
MRELLAQLAFASDLTLIAASYVGHRTARAALRDNALRHGAEAIGLPAQVTGGCLHLSVIDEGPGFRRHRARREHAFRAHRHARHRLLRPA